jgi:hypothetical protein
LNDLAKWWEHLMQTRHLTDRECLLNALAMHVEDGSISLQNARTVLDMREQPEPDDRSVSKIPETPYLLG